MSAKQFKPGEWRELQRATRPRLHTARQVKADEDGNPVVRFPVSGDEYTIYPSGEWRSDARRYRKFMRAQRRLLL